MLKATKLLTALAIIAFALSGIVSAMGLAGSTFGVGPNTLSHANGGGDMANYGGWLAQMQAYFATLASSPGGWNDGTTNGYNGMFGGQGSIAPNLDAMIAGGYAGTI